MPLTPRDRRTLMIGGAVLGMLLLGFLVMNLLSGGGGEEAAPPVAPVTTAPTGGPDVSPSPTGGVSPVPVFTGRDPFSIPPGLSPVVSSGTAPPPSDGTSPPPSDGTSPPPTSPPPTSPPPTSPPPPGSGGGGGGGGSSEEVGGKTVVLLAVFSRGGESLVQVQVDGRVFNDIGIGESFDNGRYQLRSISGECATFLFGDESFTLCVSRDK